VSAPVASGSFSFEGRRVAFAEGDTVASALYRDGVRTFTRSLKYHRRRGLYCMTGDCPNCQVNVDGEPGVRACMTTARESQVVVRETGWPNTERDALAITDHLHWAMPVGFYYKAFVRPRFAWELAERVIRRATGVGRLPIDRPARPKPHRFARADVLVVGGGVAGLAAASAAAEPEATVILSDEGTLGWSLCDPAERARLDELAREVRALGNLAVLEHHTAIGLYEGPSVPLVGPEELVEVEAERVVLATGALEAHAVFPGNDLPGVWLGRGAAILAARHGVRVGDRVVVATTTDEGLEHARTLAETGADVLVIGPASLVDGVPPGVRSLADTSVVAADGTKRLTAVVVEGPDGRRRIPADGLVLSLGWTPRDALLRMGAELPVVGAGDLVAPGRGLDAAIESGRHALDAGLDPASAPSTANDGVCPPLGPGGYVCLCEDVAVHDLEGAWREGWTSSEILKRYTTATMGPCQGALCGQHLACFARTKGAAPAAAGRTTSRPPVRAPKLEDLIGGVHETIDRRTALHDRHVALGARMDRSGAWLRPGAYGDRAEEYRAVRERVGVMDVSTLGKFLVAGRDARELLDRVLPIDVAKIASGRARYFLALDEAGYAFDDGLLLAHADRRYEVTSTSGGADRMEAWLRNWIDRFDLHVHLVNRTAELGAINVAGPNALDLLETVSDDDLTRGAIPYPGHAAIAVAGVPCRAIRSGFVGERAFELHHPRSRSAELWDALLEAGSPFGIRPHGLDTLDLLRLEKGHIYLGQDTLPDDHPVKLGLGWTVARDKPAFIGKAALERMNAFPLERRLVGLRFDATPQRGCPLAVDGSIVGRVTSCARSPALDAPIGLGWIRAVDGAFPSTLTANGTTAQVVPTPFYDPEGARLRD
jgi:sarcosine oxidase subunit alpha